VFGHSTPPPWQVEKLLKKKKKDKAKKPIWTIPEKAEHKPDYSFDQWIKSALKRSEELNAASAKAKEDDEKLDKEIGEKVKEKNDSEDKKKASEAKKEKPKEQETGPKWAGHADEIKEREKAGVGIQTPIERKKSDSTKTSA